MLSSSPFRGTQMSIVERKERHKESLRQEILDAAREILLAKGYAYLSMRRIAERIEYSPTTIYLYFKNKDDILYHLCVETLERQFEALSEAGISQPSPLLRLRAALRAYVDFGLSEPDRYKITYMADLSRYVSTASILEQGGVADKLIALMCHRVHEALVASGSNRDAKCVFQALWAHCHGMVSLLIGHPDFPWTVRETLIETGLDLSLAGLLVKEIE
ncbi:MAG: TetR/AcrR family transcriptional regulator [Deltaproteobacteria bacterium]|nr:TetR/AcrR family transcriptional regulator [Deltaproteobacteria bacterium]TLN00455.1 MAG: TetR/AcrR family transcriptional regulator [bacterium]